MQAGKGPPETARATTKKSTGNGHHLLAIHTAAAGDEPVVRSTTKSIRTDLTTRCKASILVVKNEPLCLKPDQVETGDIEKQPC